MNNTTVLLIEGDAMFADLLAKFSKRKEPAVQILIANSIESAMGFLMSEHEMRSVGKVVFGLLAVDEGGIIVKTAMQKLRKQAVFAAMSDWQTKEKFKELGVVEILKYERPQVVSWITDRMPGS